MSWPLKRTLPRRRRLERRHHTGERRLAATALPDEPEGLSGAHRQAHPIDSVHAGRSALTQSPTFHREVLHHIPNVEQKGPGLGALSSLMGHAVPVAPSVSRRKR